GGDPHALAAAAGRRLDDDGEADLARDAERFVDVGDGTGRARDRGHAGLLGQLLRHRLVAHLPDLVGRRADEGDVRGLDDLAELAPLAVEALTRLNSA